MIKYCLGPRLLNTSGEMGCEAITSGWWPWGPLGGLVPTGGSDILAPVGRSYRDEERRAREVADSDRRVGL